MLTDSHCHLDCLNLEKYQGNLSLALVAAKEQGVTNIICPSVALERCDKVLQIAEAYPNIVAAIGTHPTEDAKDPTLEELLQLGGHPKVVAIGETGLDFYYENDGEKRERQKRVLQLHIKAALELKKPLIIHSRAAAKELLEILQQENAAAVGGVMHCFTEDWHTAEEAMRLNFAIAFSGIITFKNAQPLQEIAKRIPLEKLLIETDAPYLAPVPVRGKPNEPAFLHYTAEFLAKLRNISYETLAQQTTANAMRIFNTTAFVNS